MAARIGVFSRYARSCSANCNSGYMTQGGRCLSLLEQISFRKIPKLSRSCSNSNADSSSTTHFGFKTVPKEQKQTLVGSVFSNVASKYDLMNDLMSGGLHRLWKDEFVFNILNPSPGTTLLDVAGGTGDIAFRFIEAVKSSPRYQVPSKPSQSSKVIVCDINPQMIEIGQQRAKERNFSETGDPSISWMVGNAEKLSNIATNSIDAYTISFGIRNCTDIPAVLTEAFRVLKKGGRFLCLEFSPELETFGYQNPILQSVYEAYSFYVVPKIGEVVANDRASYEYLVESIRKFPTPKDFSEMIATSGFKLVTFKTFTFGVVAIHSGFKL